MVKKGKKKWLFALCVALLFSVFSVCLFADESDYADFDFDDYFANYEYDPDDEEDECYPQSYYDSGDYDFYEGHPRYDDPDLDDSSSVSELVSRVTEARAAVEAAQNAKDAVSPERLEELIAAQQKAEAELQAYCDKHHYEQKTDTQTGNISIYNAQGEVVYAVGDPVVLASGIFQIDDYDTTIAVGKTQFALTRHYSSDIIAAEYASGGVFGAGWHSIVDSRIILGYAESLEDEVAKWDAVIASGEAAAAEIADYASEDPECAAYEGEIAALLAEWTAERDALATEAALSSARAAKNAAVGFGYAGYMARNLGCSRLVFVDDSGNPLVFESDGSGCRAVSSSVRTQLSLSYDTASDSYTVRFASGETRTYNGRGQLSAIDFVHGGSISFAYGGEGRLESVCVNGVRTLRFRWNGAQLASVTDGVQTVVYGFDGGRLVSVRDASGDEKAFSYDEKGRIIRQIKPDGSFIAFGYAAGSDGTERTVYTVNENGAKETFSYDVENRRTTYTDQDGVASWYDYDAQCHTVRESYADGRTVSYTYDADGNLASRESLGNRVSYQYDEKQHRTLAQYGDGSTERWLYADANLLSYTDRDGVTTSFDYDARGNVTALYRGGQLVSSYEYNVFGQVTREIDCRGNRTEFVYDAQGNCTQKKRFTFGATSALSVETWAYDDIGRVTTYIDARGISHRYHYAPHSTLLRSSNGYESEIIYNNRKDVIQTREKDTVTGEERIVQYEYDKCHKMTKILLSGTDGNGKTYAAIPVQTTAYTDGGRLAKRILWDSAENSAIDYIFDGAGNVARLSYGAADSEGVLLSAHYAAAYERSWTTGGYVISERLGDGRNIVRTYDEYGRLLSERDGNYVRSENEFSAAGRLVTSKTAFGGVLELSYDGASGCYAGSKEVNGTMDAEIVQCDADGKKAVSIYPQGAKTYYSYDAFGLLSRSVSDGGSESWTRDGAGRLLSHTVLSAAGKVVAEETWTYDADGRTIVYTAGGRYKTRFRINAFGEVVGITDADGNKRGFVYDIRGRCIEKSDAYGKKSYFFYDGKNQLIKAVDRNGNATAYEYDADGNCTKIANAGGIVFTARYDQSGRVLQSSQMPSAVTESYEYDGMDRITKIRRDDDVILQTIFSADGKNLTRVDAKGKESAYTTDGFGRVLSEKNRLGASQTFQYNGDGSLNHSKDFAGEQTAYRYERTENTFLITYADGSFSKEVRDAAGNIVLAQNQSEILCFTYDTAGNVLTQYDAMTGAVVSFSYDACGRRSRVRSDMQDVRYQYGKNGELIKLTDEVNKISIQFAYDAEGNEIRREHTTGEVVESFYDAAGRLVLTVGYAPNRAVVFVEGTVYGEHGERSLILNTDFSVTRYRYDGNGRIASVQYAYSEEVAAHLKNVCAQAGLHFNETSAIDTTAHHFSSAEYNALKSLCAKVGFGSFQPQIHGATIEESFTYDANGNLSTRKTPFGTITYAYDADDRLIAWGDSGSASYDANGNLLEKKDLYKMEFYTYNKSNRMERMTVQNLVASEIAEFTCRYDAFGRRTVVSSSESGAMRTVYDGLTFNDLYAARERSDVPASSQSAQTFRYAWIDDGQSARTRTTAERTKASAGAVSSDVGYVSLYGNARTPIAVTKVGSDTTDRYALFSDMVGTVRATHHVDGTQSQFAYDAFGAKLNSDRAWNPYGFAGKKSLGTSDTYDFGYRDYAADFFRFTTTDPARDGTNWYAYCNGDSINYVDLLGLKMDLVIDKDSYSKHTGIYDGVKDTRDTCIMDVYQDGVLILQIEVTVAVVSHNSSLTFDATRTQKTGDGKTHPTQFPDGTYKITAVTPNRSGDSRFEGAWLRTDATQLLNDVNTGEKLVDGGYCIHYTACSMTNGCVGVQSKDQMDALAWAVIQNEKNDPHSTTITVFSSSKGQVSPMASKRNESHKNN